MGFIYITGGEKRGHKIYTKKDNLATRPTPSIMREALFNIIDVKGRNFFDGFAGFGTVGLEALSRGAKGVVFVESDKKNVEIIRRNLDKLSFFNRATIIKKDINIAVSDLKGREPFDYIFLGPPYKNLSILRSLVPKLSMILRQEGNIIIQYPVNQDLFDFSKFGIILLKRKKYGSNILLFYKIRS